MSAETPITVRHAVARDADALAGISGRSWRATYPGIVPDRVLAEWIAEAPAMWHGAFESRPPDGPWRAWVAEREGVVLGYATTLPAEDKWLPPPDGAGELTNLYLDPHVIGVGVGRLLYEHAAADLRARGFNPFVVWAFRDNARALRFYERMGPSIDVPDHTWELGGVPCPIVRFRLDWPVGAADASIGSA
ncbi:MAG TPA: GNAT family N-acetyltransferase [Candidatus Limnocylindria bacterium]|jgi:GNAT superfamily N-acetyltransferase